MIIEENPCNDNILKEKIKKSIMKIVRKKLRRQEEIEPISS